MEWNNFQGTALPITEEQIAVEAKRIGVTWAALHGVMEVEASFARPGNGFDPARRPKMLFEPLHFYINLAHQPLVQKEALRQGLASATRPTHYPNDSYPLLKRAVLLDETAALLSCSWGFGQVMGENFRMGGWKTVQEMVLACMASETAHLQAMTGFIVSNHLVDEMQRGDAAGFARVYNGKGYATGHYDSKLLAAWKKWSKAPFPAAKAIEPRRKSTLQRRLRMSTDTPANEQIDTALATVQPGTPTVTGTENPAPDANNTDNEEPLESANVVVARVGDVNNPVVAVLQARLRTLNYACGDTDGNFGTLTRDVLLAYEANNNLPLRVDLLDSRTLNAILQDGTPRPLDPGRVTATATTGSLINSRTIKLGQMVKHLGIAALSFVGIDLGVDATLSDAGHQVYLHRSELHDTLLAFKEVSDQILTSRITVIVILAALVATAYAVISLRVQAHRDGSNLGR